MKLFLTLPSPSSLTNFSDTSEDTRLLTALRPYDEGDFELAATTLEPLAREGNLVAIFKLGTTFDRLARTANAIALLEVASQQRRESRPHKPRHSRQNSSLFVNHDRRHAKIKEAKAYGRVS